MYGIVNDEFFLNSSIIKYITMATSITKKSATTHSKKMPSGKASSSPAKKGGSANIKVPTARERAKDFDEGRRNDANSNEL